VWSENVTIHINALYCGELGYILLSSRCWWVAWFW